jgi:hypothetical protein
MLVKEEEEEDMYIVSLLRDILSSIKCLVLEINYGTRISERKEYVRQLSVQKWLQKRVKLLTRQE